MQTVLARRLDVIAPLPRGVGAGRPEAPERQVAELDVLEVVDVGEPVQAAVDVGQERAAAGVVGAGAEQLAAGVRVGGAGAHHAPRAPVAAAVDLAAVPPIGGEAVVVAAALVIADVPAEVGHGVLPELGVRGRRGALLRPAHHRGGGLARAGEVAVQEPAAGVVRVLVAEVPLGAVAAVGRGLAELAVGVILAEPAVLDERRLQERHVGALHVRRGEREGAHAGLLSPRVVCDSELSVGADAPGSGSCASAAFAARAASMAAMYSARRLASPGSMPSASQVARSSARFMRASGGCAAAACRRRRRAR